MINSETHTLMLTLSDENMKPPRRPGVRDPRAVEYIVASEQRTRQTQVIMIMHRTTKADSHSSSSYPPSQVEFVFGETWPERRLTIIGRPPFQRRYRIARGASTGTRLPSACQETNYLATNTRSDGIIEIAKIR